MDVGRLGEVVRAHERLEGEVVGKGRNKLDARTFGSTRAPNPDTG